MDSVGPKLNSHTSLNLRMNFSWLQSSKKPTQKFDEFLPYNLKSGPIKKIKALYNAPYY